MNRQGKGVMLYTDSGIRIVSLRRNDRLWTKEECFKYCNFGNDEFDKLLRSNRLKLKSLLYDNEPVKNKDWYKDENNFREVVLTVDIRKTRI